MEVVPSDMDVDDGVGDGFGDDAGNDVGAPVVALASASRIDDDKGAEFKLQFCLRCLSDDAHQLIDLSDSPKIGNSDTALTHAAQQLVNSVSDKESEKFENSWFLHVMR
ncbi:Uu.00g032000.m01.CDS01 [Anthostomella pinea]|uniref:Uu.00g032000.m01.CDS01 n=1 Tax=Anthostomella pinea TaxID=933095 RepID=A0AAI8V935_9PEZI|nr:Uu.00g032000.m01.CDS01 [Anthostomella pinea]